MRDRLLERIAASRGEPDYVRLAADVLGIRNAPAALARRLVEQALVVEDRREAWLRAGERVCEAAPTAPGVYVLRADTGAPLYVGKANNLRRRLRAHFAARRWRSLKPVFARAAGATWDLVGSEIEALLTEARLIRELRPPANVQVGAPELDTRAVPTSLVRDTLVLLPSADPARVVLLGTLAAGSVRMSDVERSGRGVATAAAQLRAFFTGRAAGDEALQGLAPLVFSWLAGRGAAATRIDPQDVRSAHDLRSRVEVVLRDTSLFAERIVVVGSGVRSTTSARP